MCSCNEKYLFYDQSWYSNELTTKNWFIVTIIMFLLASTLSLKETIYGDDLKLPCNTTIKVKWYKDGYPITNGDNERILIRKNGKLLKIKNVVQNDAGIYACIDTGGKNIIVQYNVSVKASNRRRLKKPTFKYPDKISRQRNSIQTAGHDLTLNCQAVGAMPIRYKWYKNGQRLLTRRVDPSFVADKRQLKLIGLVKSDSANYTCIATNKYGQASSNMLVKVEGRDRVSPFLERATLKNQTNFVGDNVSIVCYELATGTRPDFRWLKWTGKPNVTLLQKYIELNSGIDTVDKKIAQLIPEDFYHPTQKNTVRANKRSVVRGVELTLYNVTKKDSGYYTCIASNHIGTDYSSMYLDVKEMNDKSNAVSDNNRKNEDAQSHMQIIVIVLGSLVVIALMTLVSLFLTWKVKRRRHIAHDRMALPNFDKKLNIVTEAKRKQSSASSRAPLISISSGRMNSESTPIYGDFDDGIPIPYDPEWEIDRNCLQLTETLGEGAFGVVVKAYAPGLERCENCESFVAIKMLKADATENELMDLLSEMETMKQIGRHKNIINFLGCCTEKNPIYVVVEYAPHDNLRQFLRSKRPPPSDTDQRMEPLLSIQDMVSFSLQIAKGMEYLAAKKCIHRDLAARNVLVAEDDVMKIADFGLARSVREFEYYRKTTDGRLPVKWLAIEALFDRVYTTQSDVWAFGILLWEIFTLGGSPYPGIPIERLFDLLKSGFRMERPQICPLPTYEVMVKCWYENPTHRPSFTHLVYEIEAFLETLANEDYLEVVAGSMTSLNSSLNEDDSSEGAAYSDSSTSNSVFPPAPGDVDEPC